MSGELEILGVDVASLGVPAAMVASAGLALKWLAEPSLRAVGDAFGEWTEVRIKNLLRLTERVQKRVDPDDSSDGSVPARLLYRVLEDGSWIDDDVAQEYLAGILIGSRTESGGDEDGVYFAHVVSTLTSAQVRMHHAIYERFAELTPDLEYGDADQAYSNSLWAPLDEVGRVIGRKNAEHGATVAASGLAQAGLLKVIAIGEPEVFAPPGYFDRAPDRPAFLAMGTLLGRELYHLATLHRERYEAPQGSLLSEAYVGPGDRAPEGL